MNINFERLIHKEMYVIILLHRQYLTRKKNPGPGDIKYRLESEGPFYTFKEAQDLANSAYNPGEYQIAKVEL
jgi:hypothetical protein